VVVGVEKRLRVHKKYLGRRLDSDLIDDTTFYAS
jgi:hypothetical protein